ncbi:MAG: hypothetical protein KAU95_02700, partial [Candidatus Aenigmarchaeota archaeon]|nr:hypothetical protein [Candidatus Aenigmarchaeota archaeon]
MVAKMKKRNRNYFGFIDIADGVGKPISSEIAIEYHGNNPKKEKMAKKLHKAISRCLTDSGRLVAQYNALGMSYDGEQYYAKEGENDIDTKAHEEWHSEVYKQGYTIHPAYSEAGLSMLDESSAYAVGNYTNLLIGDKPKQAHEEIEYQKDFCSEGIELYENVLEGQEAGNIPQELIEDIIDFQKEYPLMKMLNGPNWATFLCQMSNLGLYEPCITILEEYGS